MTGRPFRWPASFDFGERGDIALQEKAEFGAARATPPHTWRSGSIDDAIIDTDTYANPARYDDLFSHLRENDPVHFTKPSGHRPFWTIAEYADINEVEGNPELFLNAPRLVLRSIDTEDRVRAATGGKTLLLRSLVNMDGREHQSFRVLTQAWFMPPRLRRLEVFIQLLASEMIDGMLARADRTCDFARDVATWFPLRVIMHILGVPASDAPLMFKLTQQIFGPDDPDIKGVEPIDLIATVASFAGYFNALSAQRRKHPTDDLASVIANAQVDGRPITDLEALSYYIIVATAGHDTTSSTLSGGLLALMENPVQLAKLQANPALVGPAIDEMLRWVAPVKHFFRTAAQRYVLRGKTIEAGDALLMCYPSANRDRDVFDEPDMFRIDRLPNRHLSFGYGPHVCLGQHLAKMELRVFFADLMNRGMNFTLAGAPAWIEANFVTGLKHLPISYGTQN